jgi:hypothetical protein
MKRTVIYAGVFLTTMVASWLFVTHLLSGWVDLPKDPCYYHVHKAPKWVEGFYLDHSGHISAEGNFLMFGLMIMVSALSTLGAAVVGNRRKPTICQLSKS